LFFFIRRKNYLFYFFSSITFSIAFISPSHVSHLESPLRGMLSKDKKTQQSYAGGMLIFFISLKILCDVSLWPMMMELK